MPTFKRSGIPKKAVKERKADKLARPLLCALRKSKTMPMKAALTAAEKKKGEKRRRLRAILAHYGECLLQFSFTQWFDKHTNFLFFFFIILRSQLCLFFFFFKQQQQKKNYTCSHFPFLFLPGGGYCKHHRLITATHSRSHYDLPSFFYRWSKSKEEKKKTKTKAK